VRLVLNTLEQIMKMTVSVFSLNFRTTEVLPVGVRVKRYKESSQLLTEHRSGNLPYEHFADKSIWQLDVPGVRPRVKEHVLQIQL